MLIRHEIEADRAAVHALNVAAFEVPSEAELVDTLRERADPVVSLVAEDESGIVGHIFFSPVTLDGHDDLMMMGLAPVAVRPGRQREGIGSQLVRAGIEACGKLGCRAMVVLGHPDFYPRFGFTPSVRFGIDSEYDVPVDVFMAMELEPGALKDCSGRVRYHAAFAEM